MKPISYFFAFLLFLPACTANKNNSNIPLFEEKNWVVEQQAGGKVYFKNNTLEIIDAKGCTVWYNQKLEAPIQIDYDVIVIDSAGVYDRVSDLNCFWMANDPMHPNDFFYNSTFRAGKFNNYHSLTQYYVGYGGHNNSKTRFRRYNGDVNRPLLPEHDLSDAEFLLTPNINIHITIQVKNNTTSYIKDGKTIFLIKDDALYNSGYFGFRTVNNHMLIKNFSVKKINF